MAIGRLSPDLPFSFAAMGVVCDPITATLGAVSAFAAANAGAIGAISTAATLAGGAVSAVGAISGGNAAKASADFKAAQMRQNGTQALASSQRQMFDVQKRTDLTLSTLQSRAAASGVGANDPTVMQLGENITQRGEMQALTDLANGENARAGAFDAAAATEASGRAAQKGGYLSAAGSMLAATGSGFSRYTGSNPFALPSVPTEAPVGGWG